MAEKKEKHAGGRPSAYRDAFVKEVEKYASIGCSEKEMAYLFDTHENTFRNWKKNHPEFLWALKKGQSVRNSHLRKAMFQSAMSKGNVVMQIFLAKNWLGMKDKGELGIGGLDNDKKLVIEVVDVSQNKKKKEDKK